MSSEHGKRAPELQVDEDRTAPNESTYCKTSRHHVCMINKKYQAVLSVPKSTIKNNKNVLAIFLHPYGLLGGSMNEPVLKSCHQNLSKNLFISCLSFNFCGIGASRGSVDWFGNSDRNTVLEVVQWGLKTTKCSSIILIGHSYGSLVGFSICPQIDPICLGCILLAPPLGVLASFNFGHLVEKGLTTNCPLLFILGTADSFTSRSHLEKLLSDVHSKNKKAIIINGGTHTFSDHIGKVGNRVIRWVKQILNDHSTKI